MIVKYRMLVDIKIAQEFEGIENLKSDREMAESVCQLIADEVATAGGACSYDIVRSEIYIDEDKNKNNFIADRFMRLL